MEGEWKIVQWYGYAKMRGMIFDALPLALGFVILILGLVQK